MFRSKLLRTLILSVGVAAFALPQLASAQEPMPMQQGDVSPGIEARAKIPPRNEFYIIPEFGFEIGSLSRAVYSGILATGRDAFYAGGVASLAIGGRWEAFNLGLRYQGSYTGQGGGQNDLQFHKLYGEIGANARGRFLVANFFLDFGYAALVSQVVQLNGLGAKAGAAVDFYPVKWFSLGPVVSFDVQGFNTIGSDWVYTLGMSMFGRIGIHI